ncbi:prepilin-type N-terminal cleavage/methylation domain-containing protein [bacterium]|nr:prepilin-type N-terminal cleavage/methylation domain-containing protein [bacterium]MCI0605026.1 prepilin-type N-terminal cleavage/methylation domain-containing protein [bacterium]
MKTKQSTQNGFTLIEILVAIVVLTAAILGAMALLPTSYKQITNAGRTTTMDHLAQMKMDVLRSLPITSSDLTDGTHPATPEFYTAGSADKSKTETFSVKWVVTDYTPMLNSKAVIVEVGFGVYNDDGSLKTSTEEGIELIKQLYTTFITQ